MRALTGDLLLSAWERCAHEHDLDRAVTMLALALPASSREQLAALPLGERNMLLLRLHEISFGPSLRGFASCSQCGEPLEFVLPAGALAERLEDRRGQASASREDEGLFEDHHHRDDREQQERVDHGAAYPQGGDEAREIHQNSFFTPAKNPRGGPNCRAKIPTPVPSRST